MRGDAALLRETFRLHATFPSSGTAGATVRYSRGLTWVDSGLDTDTFNVVLGARLAPGEVGPVLAQVRSHFESVRRPFSWWISPGDEPQDLAATLASLGLVSEEGEIAMSARIADIAETHAPRGLTISRARDAKSISHFARINAENWTPPDPLVERYFDRAAGRLAGPESPLRFYVARLDGDPVAGVEIAVDGGGLGVFNLSTRCTHRRLGIGGALMTRALLESAKEAGAEKAVLQAAPAAAGLYGRIGFASFGLIRELKPIRSV